ncbi:MAG: MFS transporter [Eubacteriales bacterium]|nr:MFS transporter [Eubacteriales bacterium]
MTTRNNKISNLTKMGYGAGNLGFGIVFQCLAAYLLFYSTAVLGIRGRHIGTIMAIGIFWDAVTDPLMGYISDITHFKKWGRRHLYLIIGTVSIAIFNTLLWNINPGFSIPVKMTFILVFFLLLKTALTVYGTPYTALGAELSDDYDERTSIQSYKTLAFLLGLALPMVVGLLLFFKATPEYPTGQLNPRGYSMMGIATSLFMVTTGLICFFSTYSLRLNKSAESLIKRRSEGKQKYAFLEALENKYFLYVFMGYLFINVSSALIGSIGLHVFTYTFDLNSNQIALVMGFFFVGSIVSLPYWLDRSKKHDKRPIMMACIKISAMASFVFLVAVFTRIVVIRLHFLLWPIVFVLGFGSGGLFMLPPSMIADTIDYEEQEKGYRSEGIYFGALTFGYKIIQSLVLFVVGVLLDLIRFDSGLSSQTTYTSIMLGVILCIGSLVAFFAGYMFFNKYTLTKDIIGNIQKNLTERKATE